MLGWAVRLVKDRVFQFVAIYTVLQQEHIATLLNLSKLYFSLNPYISASALGLFMQTTINYNNFIIFLFQYSLYFQNQYHCRYCVQ